MELLICEYNNDQNSKKWLILIKILRGSLYIVTPSSSSTQLEKLGMEKEQIIY